MDFNHVSVLKEESIVGLNIRADGIYIDCTTGGAGHSLEIAKKLTTGRLICLDKDTDALEVAKERLKDYNAKVVVKNAALKASNTNLQKATLEDKITFVNDNFANIDKVLTDLNVDKADGILADLGVSSYQIDTGERGFSFMHNGPLDMRMDKNQALTANYIINNYSEQDLAKIMFMYGEEKNSRQIARKIVKLREIAPIDTTYKLRDIVADSYPPKLQSKPNLCNKVFQAIRIEVNNELNDLPDAVEKMLSKLKKHGRLCIITFHPLEDRIIKQTFKLHSTGCICPPKLPQCVCGHVADISLITRHPIVPDESELQNNSRSASAKLRIAEKI